MRRQPLGQYFIQDDALVKEIVDTASISEGDVVFEIGSGRGALTNALLEKGARVVALEKDVVLADTLIKTHSNQVKNGQLKCIKGDIRDGIPSLLKTESYTCVSNIPYYITGTVLRVLLQYDMQPTSITLVLQDEVARRITHPKKESILSLSVKLFGTLTYVRHIPANCFSPVPNVNSALIRITDIHSQENNFQSVFFDLIHLCFKSKRKMIRAILKENPLLGVLTSLDITSDTRPEDIPFVMWKKITEKMLP